MPQLIGVKSLSQTCLDFVVNNMAVLCEKPSYLPTTINNQSRHSPFDQLPSKSLEEIISALQTKQCLKQFLGFLLAPQLGSLDLRYLSQEDNYTDLELNLLRCIYLKNLSLQTNDKFLTSVIPTFVKLQVLDISNSSVGDSSLEVIGTYCKVLRELDIQNNMITDIGVEGFCVGAVRDLESGGDGLPKSLLKLAANGSLISHVGVKLILENFHSLRVFDMATVQNLTEIHKEVFLNQNLEIPKYSLICLEIAPDADYDVYIPKTLGFVLSLCPSVTEVEIYNCEGLTDSDLLDLLSLKNLRNLKMGGHYYSNDNFTFGGGVTPILKAFGSSSLKSLSLSILRDVNVLVITQLCPNLYFLVLSNCLSYSTAKLDEECVKTEPQVLMQLKNLRLCDNYSRISIPREHLILLLSAPSLVDIYIDGCCTLEDDVLQEVARVQKFHHLENLEVKKCDNVTEKGIDIFMNAQNPLKKIMLHWCRQLTKKNVEHWEKQAKMNSWQILIQFKELDFNREDYYDDYHDNDYEGFGETDDGCDYWEESSSDGGYPDKMWWRNFNPYS